MTTDTAVEAVPIITSAGQAVGVGCELATALADGAIERDRASADPDRASADPDRISAVPADALAALDSSGLLGITVPREYGGADVPATTLAEVIRLIAMADPAIAQVPQAHFLFVDVLAAYGTQRQRQRLFGDVLAGGRLGNGQAERGGQHAQDLQTRLLNGRLTGRKYYCTGALTSRWIGVSALDASDRLVLVFVERDARGVHLDEDWNVMGQRATVSGGARFDNVLVDTSLVLPYHQAFERPQQLGARSQLIHAAIQVGIAGGALHDAGEFIRLKARPFFEAVRGGWAPNAAEDPHTIRHFGLMATRVRAAEALLNDAAAVLDEIGRVPSDSAAAARGSIAVAEAKAFASEVAVQVASDLFALSGASATDERHDLSRHWRNARTHASHDPVAWKYHHVGNYLLSGVQPPNHAQI
ncbi:MAG TPA: SfnB family sulfur acquisition oxidoreductase [Streptosporangiaceae bacterium]